EPKAYLPKLSSLVTSTTIARIATIPSVMSFLRQPMDGCRRCGRGFTQENQRTKTGKSFTQYSISTTRGYASEVWARARLHAHSQGREPALRSQHLLRRSARCRSNLYFRLRHGLPHARPGTDSRVWQPPLRCPYFRLALSLGPHSGHAVFPAAL